jgi:NADH-quinone oxidoreductase subunit J
MLHAIHLAIQSLLQGPFLAHAYFALFSLFALGCAVGLLLAKHPLNATVYLIGAMLAVAGIYGLVGSPFLGVVQVLVYAGAIMMLVVFVIMVLNKARDHEVPRFDQWSWPAAAVSLILLATFCRTLAAAGISPDPAAVRGEIAPVAASMFNFDGAHGYWLLFEIIGLVLLVAVVAAVLLAKRSLATPVAPASIAEEAHGSH